MWNQLEALKLNKLPEVVTTMSGMDDTPDIRSEQGIGFHTSNTVSDSTTDPHIEISAPTITTTEAPKEINADSIVEISDDPIITQVFGSNPLSDQSTVNPIEKRDEVDLIDVEDSTLKTEPSTNGILYGNNDGTIPNGIKGDIGTSTDGNDIFSSSVAELNSIPTAPHLVESVADAATDSHSVTEPVDVINPITSSTNGTERTPDPLPSFEERSATDRGPTVASVAATAATTAAASPTPQPTYSAPATSAETVAPTTTIHSNNFSLSTDIITAPLGSTAQNGSSGISLQSTAPVPISRSSEGALPSSAASNQISQNSQNFKPSAPQHALPASLQTASASKPYSTTKPPSAYNGNDYVYKKPKLDYSVSPQSSSLPVDSFKPTNPAYNSNTYPYKGSQQQRLPLSTSTALPLASPGIPPSPLPIAPVNKKRLVILYDKLRFQHSKQQLEDLQRATPLDQLVIIELPQLESKKKEVETADPAYQYLNICIEYNDEFESNLNRLSDFLESNPKILVKIPDIAYHIYFDYEKSWQDVKDFEKEAYSRFLNVLNEVAGKQVVQCSIINKYELKTIYLTERKDLQVLGEEIQDDISRWPNLKICDYGENFIRFFPGVKFPDGLETLNIGGGYSLETLSGFKMPSRLKTLIASKGCITSIDNVTFPASLERLDLIDNKIYFLNYVQFPSNLLSLDVSHNRIDNLRGVVFPRNLKSLSLAANPIECIKGTKFPEYLDYLDISFLPNESMTGIKFPDLLKELNLQQSMTNTRGLKLPARLLGLNLAQNGVNSINPLKLPNSIQSLHLGKNNIKTLNKVSFPLQLRELYLGDNLITTLKNIQFPINLEILDMDMDPEWEEHEKYITTLKDVVFPANLRVLKLKGHKIKSLESFEFPFYLEHLCLAHNELKIVRNIKFGSHLKILDLSGNNELVGIDMFYIPESVVDLRIAEHQVSQLPAYVIERANLKQLTISVSPWRGYHHSHDMHSYH